jgi:hypothetical protein
MKNINKLKSAVKKIKNTLVDGAKNNFMLSLNDGILKKLVIGSLIFAAGYTFDHIPGFIKSGAGKDGDGNTIENIKIGNNSVQNWVNTGQFIISASRPELVEKLTLALDELARINPFTKGCVEDAKRHNQKFIIIPDSVMKPTQLNRTAFFVNGEIYLNEEDVSRYINLLVKSDQFNSPSSVYSSLSEDLLGTILHELRHAQQARVGIIFFNNSLFKQRNLIDYVVTQMWLEGDASAYAEHLLRGPSNENDHRKLFKKNKFSGYISRFFNGGTGGGLWYDYSSFALKEKDCFSHIIEPEKLSDITDWRVELSNDTVIADFDKLFSKLSIPVSNFKDSVSYDIKTSPLIYKFQDQEEFEHAKDYYKDGFDNILTIHKMIPYAPLLALGGQDISGKSSKEHVSKLQAFLTKLRTDKEFTLNMFESVLRQQNPEYYAKQDSINMSVMQAKDARE